jgi:hypothetical protein
VARISVGRRGRSYRITLEGDLSARDLKRLERACRYALEHKLVPLDLDLEHVNRMDDVARAYVERLQARGARVHPFLSS